MQLETKVPEIKTNTPSLPIEILLQIFSHVSTCDLMLNVAKASKAFYVLTKETSVHISVTFSDNVEEQSALKFLEKKQTN